MSTTKRHAVRTAAWLVVLAVLTLCGGAAQQAKPLRDAGVLESVPAPSAARGLTFVEGHLWSIDPQKGVLLKVSPAARKVIGTLPVRIAKPRALAWDGRSFWCAGEDVNKIHQVDAANGRILKSIEIPKGRATTPLTLEALAWDGKYLWVGYAAGWSSRVMRVDVADGRVVQSLFSEGIPRGLASDGKSLWMATYNLGKYPSLLARWTILDDPVKMSLTHVFVARLPGKEPVGLVWDSGAFWYADREQRAFLKIQLPAEP